MLPRLALGLLVAGGAAFGLRRLAKAKGAGGGTGR